MKAYYPATQDQINSLETLEDFRDYFASIPVERWTTNILKDTSGKCCARGWLGTTSYKGTQADKTLDALVDVHRLIDVNNGGHPIYSDLGWDYLKKLKQMTPKYRTLAYLDNIIAEQNG